jgi:epoxyqueuosine reductase
VPNDAAQTGQSVLRLATELGFAAAGICDATPTHFKQELLDWLAAGKHGSMDYLARNTGARLDPTKVLPGARSVVMVADLHASRDTNQDPPLQPGHGRIARYARGRDYHVVIKTRLHSLADQLRARFPEAAFRAFVDTAPILEREYAARAGLGWVGKHTLLIHPRLGSYMLLGGLLTTLDLTPPPEQEPVTDHCGTCTRCIDACPTGAINEGDCGAGVRPARSIDASRCISYLTIERRGPIDPQFHSAIGDWLYGCDVCQEVCPHNSVRDRATDFGSAKSVLPGYEPQNSSFNLLDVLNWTEADRAAAFQGRALKRATLAMMKRNALLVLANHPLDGLALARIGQVAADPFEADLVRETARGILARTTN